MGKMILLFFTLVLSSCTFFQIHTPIIEQGNIITESKVSKLHTGMTPSEVVAIMGTPVLQNVFSIRKIKYVYTYQVGSQPRLIKEVICTFSAGRLESVGTIKVYQD